MRVFTADPPLAQPVSAAFAPLLLTCVDRADDPSDAKAMLLEMCERGLLTRSDCRSEIARRGLAAA